MADSKTDLNKAANKAVDGWMSEYLEQVFGVTLSDGDYAGQRQNEAFAELETEDMAEILAARFNELDLAPKDGVVTLHEIERALANPLLHWKEKDLYMIRLLRRYYTLLVELSDDEKEVLDRGISRHDVTALAASLTEISREIRRRMQKEFDRRA